MMNQFIPVAIEPQTYTITVNKRLYKLYRRLMSLDSSCEVIIYTDDRGNIKSLRVLKVKEEVLDLGS